MTNLNAPLGTDLLLRGPIAYALPSIPDSAPPEIKDALAARRQATLTGVCPECDGRPRLPNRAERRRHRGHVPHAVIWHDPDCPATDARLTEAVTQWQARR